MMRRWRNLAPRQRRRFDPPWPLFAVPQVVPGFRGQPGRRWTPTARRGEFFAVPLALFTPPASIGSSNRRAVPTRRGVFLAVPPAKLVPPPPAVPRQSRRLALPAGRGRFAQPPWPQQPPVLVPRPARSTAARSLLIRRGQFLLIPPTPAAAAWPAPGPPRQSRRLVLTRRGVFLPVPLVGAEIVPPPFQCQDFTTTVTVVAYSATATVDAYSAGAVTVSYTTAVTVDTDSATARVCGR